MGHGQPDTDSGGQYTPTCLNPNLEPLASASPQDSMGTRQTRLASLFRRNQRVVQRLFALVGLARAQAFGPGGDCRALRDRAAGQAEVHLTADLSVRGADS